MRVVRLSNRYSPEHRAIGLVAFHPAGGQVFAQSGCFIKRRCFSRTTFHLVEVASGQARTTEIKDHHWDVAVGSPDGRFAAAAIHWSRGAVVVYLREPWSAAPARGFRLGHTGDAIAWLAFAPDGMLYAALNRSGMVPGRTTHVNLFRVGPAQALRAFDMPLARKSLPFESSTEPILDGALESVGQLEVNGLAHDVLPSFTPDGRQLATWTYSGPALVIDTSDGSVTDEVTWKGRAHVSREGYRIALSPNGQQLALIGGGVLFCHRLDGSGKPWRTKQPVGHVTDAAFHPGGRVLIVIDRQGQAHRLDAATGKVLQTLDWESGMLLCVACSPDGTAAAAGGEQGNLVLWDLDD